MADNTKVPSQEVHPGTEFQSLPLDFIVAAPLVAAVNAQRAVVESTKNLLLSMIDKDNQPIPIEINYSYQDTATTDKKVAIKAPLLTIVPMPHLRIDSLTTHFKYEITQTIRDTKETQAALQTEAKTGAALSPWVSASLSGNVSSKSSNEASTNRSGCLEITVHASEAPMPEGLSRLLSLLTNAIPAPAPVTPAS